MPEPIDRKQIQIIHIARAQLRLAEESYRDLLASRYAGTTRGEGRAAPRSSKDLSYAEADDLINYFKRLGFKLRTKMKPCQALCQPRERRQKLPDNVVVMVSPRQLRMITHLIQDIDWKARDGFERWLVKYHGIAGGLRGIKDSLTAGRIIEGLKGFWKSQNCNCKLAGKGVRHGK